MNTESTLAARVQRLEDTQAITDLKHRYASLCDTGFDADAITALFAPDRPVSWRSNLFGEHEGHAAIHAFFTDVRDQITWANHYMANPTVRIAADGRIATGQWQLLELATMPSPDTGRPQAVVMTGRYRDTFARIGDRWWFTEIAITFDRRATADRPWTALTDTATEPGGMPADLRAPIS